jgi:adenine-specific DNA methylase
VSKNHPSESPAPPAPESPAHSTLNSQPSTAPPDTRLIERWLPIAELSEESVRERRSLQALPPTYYLHVWWARRPLVASRAAILASLLPADADHDKFQRILGIHGDPVAAKLRIAQADRKGERLGADAYGYPRAFTWAPDSEDRKWLQGFGNRHNASILDPTAGGGSIPFEAMRLGLPVFGNDLNPVAALIEYATVKWPSEFGPAVKVEFEKLGKQFTSKVRQKLAHIFPSEPEADCRSDAFLWARTIRCPYCNGIIPLSPNWRLASDGTGVRLLPQCAEGPSQSNRYCRFEIVRTPADTSPGTVADGDATCPFPDCNRIVSGDDVKQQAQAGLMGDQLYTVVFKRRVRLKSKSGSVRDKWQQDYRAPQPSDDNSAHIQQILDNKLPEWEALDQVPNEQYPIMYCDRSKTYGINQWRDLFSARQLLCHGTCVEVFSSMYAEQVAKGTPAQLTKAAFIYLALSLDKLLNWNARLASWNVQLQSMRSVFDRHDFSFKWSYAEMAPMVEGLGPDWVVKQTSKCIGELVNLIAPGSASAPDPQLLLHDAAMPANPSAPSFHHQPVTITCKSGDALDHLADTSVDCVVMDPPYYDNVMYAELSDFFYVWLKRTAGQVMPELFRRPLTDKENEAVANPSKFRGQKGAKALAGRDYQDRMATIFAECRRVLKADGIMTLMFTHKATGAWDALTKALMQASFTITASWPINTEAQGSLHIKDKAAANSTIFLACRPRATKPTDADTQYWEDVEHLVAGAVRKRVAEFQRAGIRGVDLYLASFGPALEEFSKHWPLKRGTPNPLPPSMKRAQKDLFPEVWDPYAVSPEDALNAARREVKRWRLEQLTHKQARTELDPRTSWFVLAWDAFQAPTFPYDEALRLARAVGVDLDTDIVGSLAEKKGSDLTLWDSVQRANKGALSSADGSSGMIDALHHAAYQARTKTLEAARELLERAGVMGDANFRPAMQAILEVLPVGTAFSGVDLPTDVAGAGNDFEALEKLRRLAFADQVEAPQQLLLWQSEQPKK